MGPVENPRTINLIQWTMQLVALILIYLSSYHQVASFSLVMAILVWSSVPDKWKTQVQVQYHRKFVKPKVRLLSEQEYLDQSRVETEKALRELRDYCQVWSLKQFFPLPIFGSMISSVFLQIKVVLVCVLGPPRLACHT